jgi:anaerobic selenocysteine-containing dehydrogenase
LGWKQFRKRILEYPPDLVARITGVSEAQIKALGQKLATRRPTGIRLAMGMQRHAGGGMAARTIAMIPGVTGDWKYPGGGALYSTGYFFEPNYSALHRDDLRRGEPRKLSMTRLGEGLLEKTDPPVTALIVYSANPLASTSDQNKIRRGLEREDLFTVVIEHFQTDTADYADILLPATMQTEHADLHSGYGHLYLLWNEPAVTPPGECIPNTEIFRRLARKMGLNEPCLYDSDEDMARAALISNNPSVQGITLESLRARGWARLNYPKAYLAFQDGFPTPSGKLEFLSARAAKDGHDPLPGYTPPKEVTDTKLAERYPLALITPASHYFLNSTFANKPDLKKKAGPVRIRLHPEDASRKRLANGDHVRIFNDRGAFKAIVEVSNRVRPGVAAATKAIGPS